MNPLAIPKNIMQNRDLKKYEKIYDFAGANEIIARKVEKPPWKMLEPICLKAISILNFLFSPSVNSLPFGFGGNATRKQCAIWHE
jgi:hypothetical protein